MRITLSYIHNESHVPQMLKLCPGDSRITVWANEAQERLLNYGRWWDTTRRANFCVQDSCFAFPREVATIEAISACNTAYDVHSSFYQLRSPVYQTGCAGCKSGTYSCGHLAYEERNTAASFAVTKGVGKKIRIRPANSADNGKKIVLQGYDSNKIWVRKDHGAGNSADGEQVTLATPFVDTTTLWWSGAPTSVIKDLTQYLVRLYEFDPATNTERLLAVYQPGETLPTYRTGHLPGIPVGCCCTDASSPVMSIDCIVSLQHVPVYQDNDFFVITNLGAFKQAIKAMKLYEEGDEVAANVAFYGMAATPNNGRGVLRKVDRGGAIPLLNAELYKMTGGRSTVILTPDHSRSFRYDMLTFR